MSEFIDLVGTQVVDRDTLERAIGAHAAQPTARQPFSSTGGHRAWAEADGKFWGTPQSHKVLPSGVYRLNVYENLGPVFLKQKNDTDSLISLPDSESAKIVAEIQHFKGLRDKFTKHGFLYKRGILMWGPPGGGKTSTLQLLMRMLMEDYNSVALLVDNPSIAGDCLQSFRRIEPDRQIIAILEDLDALCARFGESEFLSLLDGESQVDNIVWISTTNYPERLDKRFVDRPSRFDTIRYIGMPTADARATYLSAKVPELGAQELKDYVAKSDGYSIAHLRELIILTRCFEVSLADAVARLNQTRLKPPSSDKAPDAPAFGFA